MKVDKSTGLLKLWLVMLALTVLVAVSCGRPMGWRAASDSDKEMTAEEIVEAVQKASGKVRQYEIDGYTEFRASGQDDESTPVSFAGNYEAEIDNDNRQARISVSASTESPDEDNPVAFNMEYYVLSGMVYLKLDMPETPSTWLKQRMPTGYWETQFNDIMRPVELLTMGSPKVIGSEVVHGVDSWVLTTTASKEDLWDLYVQDMTLEEIIVTGATLDFEKLDIDYSIKLWVGKKSYFVMKEELMTTLSYESTSLYLAVRADYSDHNELVHIALPADAARAVEKPFLE